jgi:hypothetical protein
VQIPGLGEVVEDEPGWHRSEPLAVPLLGGAPCTFLVEEYDGDERQEDFHEAIRAFLAVDSSALTAAAPSIFAYYVDVKNEVAANTPDWAVEINGPDDALNHIQLGNEPTVSRDEYGDRHVYVSLECECDWEPEHGLQIVFRDGRTVTRVGPYDGHLTNAAAYADDTLDGVVYRPR